MTNTAEKNKLNGQAKASSKRFSGWLKSSSFQCLVIHLVAVAIIIALFFLVCVPKKYDLQVGSISHDTINATKDVVDEVATQEKRNAVASLVEPKYLLQQEVKEEVMSSLGKAFSELRTIQQYGLTLRPEGSEGARKTSFTEDEIAYAMSLLDDLTLTRTSIVNLLKIDTDKFEEMVSTVTIAVENTLNSSIREGQVSQAIQTILQIVGYKLDISLTQTILPTVLRYCIQPNMIIDQSATEEARTKAMESVEPVVYLQGQNIIREGDRITKNQLEMLRQLGLLNEDQYDYSSYWGSLITVLLAAAVFLISLSLLRRDVLSNVRQMAVIWLILMISIGLAALSNQFTSVFLIPAALGATLATVLIGHRVAVCMTAALSILLPALLTGNGNASSYEIMLITVLTVSENLFTIWFLKGHPQRVRVLLSGLVTAAISAIMILGFKLLTSAENALTFAMMGMAAVGSILSGVLAVALQPAFEMLFHLPTPTRLLELTNPNQPLMKRLMMEAPGTYHHSIIVANLAEAAASSIGANPYLARAGAYYHDIGKLKRPMYFKENQTGDNPHEHTDPYVSAAILTSHPTDGMLMAQKEHIPPEIQQIIMQHHGITPVMFFYHKALQNAGGKQVDINEFRYAGPKPNTKEAAVVMLADTIEAAVRSLKNPTPREIDQFIERLIRGKLEDDQLSDSPLSLKDLDLISKTFSGILKGVYHERIEYPNVPIQAVQQQYTAGDNDPSGQENDAVQKQDNGDMKPAENTAEPADKKAPDKTALPGAEEVDNEA